MPPFVFAVIGTFLQCFKRFLRTFLFFFVRFGGSSDGLNFDNFRDTAPYNVHNIYVMLMKKANFPRAYHVTYIEKNKNPDTYTS